MAAALVMVIKNTAFALISDGDISSDDINEIFDEALEENTELVTKLCKENLNETKKLKNFLKALVVRALQLTIIIDTVIKMVDKC